MLFRSLYCDKPVDVPTLDKMIGNLTLKLDEEDEIGRASCRERVYLEV